MSNTNREDKTMTIRQLSDQLNCSTSDWNAVARPVLDDYTETSQTELDDFIRVVVEKRDQAQKLLDMLFDMEDQIYKTPEDF
jgi:hypothetical protein